MPRFIALTMVCNDPWQYPQSVWRSCILRIPPLGIMHTRHKQDHFPWHSWCTRTTSKGNTIHKIASLFVAFRVPAGTVDTILSYCHYSLNDQTLADMIPYLKEKRVGIINASALSMGLLTDQASSSASHAHTYTQLMHCYSSPPAFSSTSPAGLMVMASGLLAEA